MFGETAKQRAKDYLYENTMEWLREEMKPEDVFDEEQLDEWALANDYVKKEAE